MSSQQQIDPDIFKAYDVRGVYPTELNEDTAYRIGRAFVQHLGVNQVAVGRDMRVSSPAIAAAIMRGATDQGADAIDLGLTTTDELYFAVGKYSYPAGVMITASHNPGQYNGIKMCREEAIPISSETGGDAIRDIVLAGQFASPARQGQIIKRDVTDAYVDHCLSFIDVSKVKPYKIAVDAGNGMAGMVIPRVFQKLPCQLVPLYFELDGTFPNHPASPIEPENTEELRRVVPEQHCDMGIAFDGDADRMFLVDEKGNLLGGDMVTALVARSLLTQASWLHDSLQPDLLALRTRVDRARGWSRDTHARGPLVHQGDDAPGERDLRRRALRTLLLPRQLVRRLRPDRLLDCARVSEPERPHCLGVDRHD